jgi:hypothetical protein
MTLEYMTREELREVVKAEREANKGKLLAAFERRDDLARENSPFNLERFNTSFAGGNENGE